ncbi:hypothetical protein SVAN01_03076 [Stagonosporopsis vannaccii]|nr:hypothetical protein SVAN01_03076 [Stagonosporopsis vannaccii]
MLRCDTMLSQNAVTVTIWCSDPSRERPEKSHHVRVIEVTQSSPNLPQHIQLPTLRLSEIKRGSLPSGLCCILQDWEELPVQRSAFRYMGRTSQRFAVQWLASVYAP